MLRWLSTLEAPIMNFVGEVFALPLTFDMHSASYAVRTALLLGVYPYTVIIHILVIKVWFKRFVSNKSRVAISFIFKLPLLFSLTTPSIHEHLRNGTLIIAAVLPPFPLVPVAKKIADLLVGTNVVPFTQNLSAAGTRGAETNGAGTKETGTEGAETEGAGAGRISVISR